jgi:hypothetical protein
MKIGLPDVMRNAPQPGKKKGPRKKLQGLTI